MVVLAAGVNAQTIRRAPAFAGFDLVAPPTAGWPTNGGDWYNRRYSPLTQIDRGNVATLKGVWRTHLRGSGLGAQYSGEAQPLVHDGVIYVVTGANDHLEIWNPTTWNDHMSAVEGGGAEDAAEHLADLER